MLKFCAAGDSDFDSEIDEFDCLGDVQCNDKEPKNEVQLPVQPEKFDNNCLINQSSKDCAVSFVLLTDLQNAVITGNTGVVESLIKSNPLACNATLSSGWTPLIYAANFGNLSVVKVLLKYGADVNKKDSNGCTPLIAACKCHKKSPEVLEIVSILINSGSDVAKYDATTKTALMYAARSGNCSIIDLLISNNKDDINHTDKNGWTALDWAISKSFSGAVKTLIDNGANVCNNNSQSTSGIIKELLKPIIDLHSINNNLERECMDSGDSAVNLSSVASSDINENGFGSLAQLDGLKNETITIAKQSNIIDDVKEYQTYGQLELILCGLELSHLISLFHDHDVKFEQLLHFTADDLNKVGVKKLGVQKRILSVIKDWHVTKWSEQSIPNFTSTALSFDNLQSILKSSTEHVLYISSSLTYVRNQLENYPQVLVTPASVTHEKDPHTMVLSQVEDLLMTTHKFCRSLKELHILSLALKKGEISLKQADYIEPNNHNKKSNLGKIVLCVSLPCAVAMAIFCSKHMSLHKFVPSFR